MLTLPHFTPAASIFRSCSHVGLSGPIIKFALQGPQSTAPATKSALQDPQILHLRLYLHFKVHKVLRLPRNLHFKVHKALHLPRNLHQGPQSTAPATTSENEPHVQVSRFTAPVTKSEHAEDLRQAPFRSQCFAQPRAEKLHLEISERNFSASLRSQNARAQRAYPDRTRAFTPTVKTSQCGHTVWGSMRIHDGLAAVPCCQGLITP